MTRPKRKARASLPIWAPMNRQSFVADVKALRDLIPVPAQPKIYFHTVASQQETNFLYCIPFDNEVQLVDDLAFISDDKVSGETVSAVSTRTLSDRESLQVYLAANDGISQGVQKRLEQIFRALESCARQKLGSEAAKDQLFDNIVRLNQDKIRWQFAGSSAEQTPTKKKPLPQKLEKLIEVDLASYVGVDRQEELEHLQTQAKSLRSACKNIESPQSKDRVKMIKLAIHAAYALTGEDFNLAKRIQDMGLPESEMENSRVIRDINLIANYWRTCERLVRMSRRYRGVFRNIQFFCLPREHKYIHAEIQILVHFELNPTAPRPRVIGVSKEACFLCDKFIHEHNIFYISKAHRRLYHNWNVPENRQYTKKSAQRIRSSLLRTHTAVRQKLEAAKPQKNRKRRCSLPFPAESNVNHISPVIPTPSVVTVLSSATPSLCANAQVATQASEPTYLVAPEHVSTASSISSTLKPGFRTCKNSPGPKDVHTNDTTHSVRISSGTIPAIEITDFGAGASCAHLPGSKNSAKSISRRMSSEAADASFFGAAAMENSDLVKGIIEAPMPSEGFYLETPISKQPYTLNQHFFISINSVSKPVYPNRITDIESEGLRLEISLQKSSSIEKSNTMKASLVSVTPATSTLLESKLPVVDINEMEPGLEITLDNGGTPLGFSSFILKLRGNELVRLDCHWP